jgi:hypothetical protein
LTKNQFGRDFSQWNVKDDQDKQVENDVEEERDECRMGGIVDRFHLHDPVRVEWDQQNGDQYCAPSDSGVLI